MDDENKVLRSEIKDLKTTLKINKGIIEDFFKKNNNNDISNLYINKLKEEINTLSQFVSKLTKEKEHVNSKLNYTVQISNDTLNQSREECEILKSKMFVYDNLIMMKDSIIENMKCKISKFEGSEAFKGEVYEKEIYVLITLNYS